MSNLCVLKGLYFPDANLDLYLQVTTHQDATTTLRKCLDGTPCLCWHSFGVES
jgi:hypothetical protein